MLQSSAYQLLVRAHSDPTTKPPPIGRNWVVRFLTRHPELSVIKQKPVEILRTTSHDPAAISRYFTRLKRVIDEHGIQLADIWNYDETGFRVGIGDSQWIITLQPDRKAILLSDSCRELVTCCECISADGGVILPGSNIYTAWTENDLPANTLLVNSDTGYTDDCLALEWIRHFDRQTRRGQGGYRLLLLVERCEKDTAVLSIITTKAGYIQAIIGFTEIRINGVNKVYRGRCFIIMLEYHVFVH
ncbi:DDE superfamily endonuclease CENP-B-like protein [Macrophomina phaseolina MS6]|uniref:DDE superfamily endonuclease CENP-B-like protein n=1 Tax=Macrophomina phaseolina (strain MS6) TaxID=1126212 RepID=K2R5C8_MACPH|nr:DDE superfamily endonuclease CENP-B-like protein [Macrophomina phaseolina MS6]